MRLKDQVAVVTGSSTGIGRAVAERFAREGADVVINYRKSADEAAECLKAVEAAGRRGLVIQADMANVEAVRGLIDQTVETFGRIDVLVANAGVEKETPVLEIDEQHWDWIMDINLKGAFFAAQSAAKHMSKRFDEEGVGGRIIFMSSVHEEIPFPLHAAYCASKGGLKLLCRNLAVELGHKQIAVNNVCPGAIKTPINAPMLGNPERVKDLIAQTPLGRVGETDDVTGVVTFLASEEARYVTGSSYFVDGGLTWHYEE
ncbi:SDR family NAD(P)-dependent oxidoreductase [Alienimonas chondri]|uniref:Glucose 1-dehydrogenase 4 n=1 Tax=Alienimonas chondri TaxID=2681879 RepID=A0ABX1VGC6_9PLAN|nr:glucose 1-dehydrogenase [Alienimonas chondri]NNJ25846.1 Glucose 1-dehydrogenase 4 [Alienimonas chondri]